MTYGHERELLQSQGRHDAARLTDQAFVASRGMDDPALRVLTLGEHVWDDMAAGDPGAADRRMQEAWQAAVGQSDPRVNVYLDIHHTDILLMAGSARATRSGSASCATAGVKRRGRSPSTSDPRIWTHRFEDLDRRFAAADDPRVLKTIDAIEEP